VPGHADAAGHASTDAPERQVHFRFDPSLLEDGQEDEEEETLLLHYNCPDKVTPRVPTLQPVSATGQGLTGAHRRRWSGCWRSCCRRLAVDPA